MSEFYYGTGRRKSSVAKVYIKPGKGNIIVNEKTLETYFPRKTACMIVRQPLEVTNLLNKFDIVVHTYGGGVSGQAGATRLGISRALLASDEALRSLLRKAGYLTRDARVVERKKYGRHKARKRPQYSKR